MLHEVSAELHSAFKIQHSKESVKWLELSQLRWSAAGPDGWIK
jgi:hypothetical protein